MPRFLPVGLLALLACTFVPPAGVHAQWGNTMYLYVPNPQPAPASGWISVYVYGGYSGYTMPSGTAYVYGWCNGVSTTYTVQMIGGFSYYAYGNVWVNDLAEGTHYFSSYYNGGYASTTLEVTAAAAPVAAPTTTTISAPTVTSAESASVTVTVAATSGTATPTGNVTLSVDGGAGQTATLSGGVATFAVPSQTVGVHALTATYTPQGSFAASDATGSLNVTPPPATAIAISAPDVTAPNNATVTVTVSSASGSPGGSVTLVHLGNTMTQTLSGGSATFTLTTPSIGVHVLEASYAAQGNFAGSYGMATMNVNPPPATTIAINAPNAVTGTNATVTVTVTSASGTPSGTVTLSYDGGASMTQTLSNGTATFTLPSPSIGTHVLSASYTSPTGNYMDSTGAGAFLGTIPTSGIRFVQLGAPADRRCWIAAPSNRIG